MELTVHASAPTRADLAGGTLDIWPVAQIMRMGLAARGEGLPPLHAPVLTLNAALELRTSCTIKACGRTGRQNQGTVLVVGGRPFQASNPQDASQLLKEHPLVGTAAPYCMPDLSRRFDRVEIETASEVPRGSGLGGSSSLLVSLLSAFSHLVQTQGAQPESTSKDPRFVLSQTACGLEAGMMGGLAGIQDHLGAAFGGLSSYELCPDGRVNRHALPNSAAQWLETHGLLVQSGDEHHSGSTNGRLLRRLFEGEAAARGLFESLALNAAQARQALERGHYNDFSAAAARDWSLRKDAFPELTTASIEALTAAARNARTCFIKVCGAAAGGVLMILFDGTDQSRQKLVATMEDAGAKLLPLRVAKTGVLVKEGT